MVRAIDIVELALSAYGAPLYVRKEIVHNLHVVKELASRGAIFVNDVEDVPPGARLVYSAHGVAPSVRRAAKERNLHVIDATCPLVTKVHLEAVKFAKTHDTIVLIGHKQHDETIGTRGEAPEQTIVVSSADEAEQVEIRGPKIAYLTQTTLSVDETASIIGVLRRRFPQIQGPPAQDICFATENRQGAVRRSTEFADLLLVVGSQNSSNSRRMIEVAAGQGLPGHLIDDETEIRREWLNGVNCVAVSAGASAPESIVQRLVVALKGFGFPAVREVEVVEENIEFPLPLELQSVQQAAQLHSSS